MLFDAHNHAFRVFGGVPRRGIYDNMRTAIDKVGRGKERDVNRFGHGQPLPVRTRVLQSGVGLGEGTGREERPGCAHRLWQPMPRFPSLEALNDWLEQRCKEFWQRPRMASDARHHRRHLGRGSPGS
jgi:hypothetical protein